MIKHIEHYKLSANNEMYGQGAWNTSPFSEKTSYDELEKEVQKKNYTVQIEYQTISHAETDTTDVLNNVSPNGLRYMLKYDFEPNKPVKNTQEYSLYDENNNLLLRTRDYDELRQVVEAL